MTHPKFSCSRIWILNQIRALNLINRKKRGFRWRIKFGHFLHFNTHFSVFFFLSNLLNVKKLCKMFPRKLTSAAELSLKTLGQTSYEYEISDSGYGKDHVKILHVRRDGTVHHIKEFEVNTHLKLYSKKDYISGKCTMRPNKNHIHLFWSPHYDNNLCINIFILYM